MLRIITKTTSERIGYRLELHGTVAGDWIRSARTPLARHSEHITFRNHRRRSLQRGVSSIRVVSYGDMMRRFARMAPASCSPSVSDLCACVGNRDTTATC
jgi:hypothetical protein